jgi:hypothetical protein
MAKWKCLDCGEITTHYLQAANPFDETQEVIGCPVCCAVNSMVRACDKDGCTREACCGITTNNGYAMTCAEHMPLEIDAREYEIRN